ncbi:MAG TPA: alpha/beta hydrolase [Tepidisphaeraceae bacterium]|jgi:acetyl esterase/lipase
MRSPAIVLALCYGLCAAAFGAEPSTTIKLWPGTPPGDTKDLGAEKWSNNNRTLTNVSTPDIAVYRPDKAKDAHVAILVCPGGGFTNLAMQHEGSQVAQWLNSIGITGIVLKYRVPAREGMPRYMAGFQDGQRAMSIVRSKAAEWQIDPAKIGIMGFSAGGQVAADVETNFERSYKAVDDMDKVDIRPDFAILVYPGGIVPRTGGTPGELTPDVKVTDHTPPTMLVVADNDPGVKNSIYMYLALKQAKVPAELHVYSEGGHGFGMNPSPGPHATWTHRVEDWLDAQHILKPAK